MENNAPPPAYHIASVDHALRLLLMLKSQPRIRVSDAADELGVARSTAHRLLGMLVYHGFAAQDPSSRAYRPGPVLVEIGMGALTRLDVRQRARTFLVRVATLTGETTSLQILEGTQARFVDSVESINTVRVGSRAGVSLPAHLTSGGRAMLAAMSNRALLLLYPNEKLGPPLTEASVTSRKKLIDELAVIRAQGYSVSHEQSTSGLIAIGVAVHGSDRAPLAAITVAGPASRMGPEKIAQAAEALQESVRELEAQLSSPVDARS